MTANQPVERRREEAPRGRLSRRDALRRAMALGVSLPAALALLARPAAARWPSAAARWRSISEARPSVIAGRRPGAAGSWRRTATRAP